MRNFGGWKKRPREFPQPDAAAFQPLGAALAFALPLAQEQMASFLPLAPASQANQSPMAPGTTIGAAAPATQGEELRPISGCKAGAAQQSFSKGGCGDAAEKKPRRALPPKLSGKSEKVKAVQLSALSGIKAIIFDLDGVVVDSEKAHLATFNQVLRPLGVSIGPRAWGRNYTGIGSVRIMEDVFQKNGIRGDAQALVEKRAKAYQEHLERQGLPAIEGFMEFHSMVSQQGVRSMVASGGHRPHIATSLRSIGLPSMQFVGLGDVKRPKPNPDIFLLAAKRLGVKPSQCIVIEDSLSGVRAAAAAEMGCIALSTTLPASVLQGKAGAVFQNYRSKKMRKLVLRLIFGKKKAGKEKEGEKRRTKEDAKPAGSRAKKKGKRVRMPAVLEF
jgi:HAD superfamily hydrolase (TIGR01509 family)